MDLFLTAAVLVVLWFGMVLAVCGLMVLIRAVQARRGKVMSCGQCYTVGHPAYIVRHMNEVHGPPG